MLKRRLWFLGLLEVFIFFFKQKTAYEILSGLVGSGEVPRDFILGGLGRSRSGAGR